MTPCLLRSRVWLYLRVVVSKSHENTSKYVDTVTLFSKARTKGHWPLDDLWTHVCWGHMGDSTQGSLCPSPMGIHQCMWIQWSILQNDHILHTHTTYYVQNEWSHSLLLNSVQARQLLNSVQARQLLNSVQARQKLQCRCIFFFSIFNFINRKQQCANFLSIEQEDIHTQTIIYVGVISFFDISFASKSETDSNIWFNK